MATSITNTSVTTDNLTVDTSTLYVDAANNRVGVGTVSPSQALHVVGEGFFEKASADSVVGVTSTGGSGRSYQIRSQTSGEFYVYDSTAGASRLTVDSSGYVTMPNQPAFSMTTSNNAGMVPANTDIILNAGYNSGNHVNTSTGIFTAPIAGRYYFSAFSIKNNASGTVARLQILQNGSIIVEARMDETGNYDQAHCSVLMNLAANDQVKFRNGDSTIFYMSGRYGRCNGYLVG